MPSKIIESIKRTQHIRTDQEELLKTAACTKILPSTIKYTEYLLTVKGHNILAHLYTRHFGDLYGGQILKTKVPGSGTMYQFDNRKELIDFGKNLITIGFFMYIIYILKIVLFITYCKKNKINISFFYIY
jgi:hypothetical protein